MAKKSKKKGKKKSQYRTIDVAAKVKERFGDSPSVDRFTQYSMIPTTIQVKKPKSKKKSPKFEIKRRFSAF